MLTNLPNLLTLSRILVIPPIVALLYVDGDMPRWIALGLYAVACVTDFFDGYIARSMGQISKLGRFLDPVADKLLVAAVIFMLVATERISGVVVLPALVILIREILVWVAAILTLITGYDYLRAGLGHLTAEPEARPAADKAKAAGTARNLG